MPKLSEIQKRISEIAQKIWQIALDSWDLNVDLGEEGVITYQSAWEKEFIERVKTELGTLNYSTAPWKKSRMSKSDAEWQALDEQLAREVMGWRKWDELPEDARRAYWKRTGGEPEEWEWYNRLFWWSLDESGCPTTEILLPDWQPHEDVAQAMEVLKALQVKILEHQGWATATLTIRLSPGRCRLKVANILGPRADDVPKVICLTAEQWANAQKEAQDDPG